MIETISKWMFIIGICGLVAILAVLIIGSFVGWSIAIGSPLVLVPVIISLLLFGIGGIVYGECAW